MPRRQDLPPERQKFHPIPENGEWWETSGWQDILGRASRPEWAAQADHALRKVFPPEVVLEFEETHPFCMSKATFGGGCTLLVLGLALMDMGYPEGLMTRLRISGEFDGAEFEAWTGLFFQALGAQVEHEPLGIGIRGPDWKATLVDGVELSVESKRPQWSDHTRQSNGIGHYVGIAFSQGIDRSLSDRNLHVSVCPDAGEYWGVVNPDDTVDQQAAEDLGARLATHVNEYLRSLPEDGVHKIDGAIVELSTMDGDAAIHTSLTIPSTDTGHEVDRVRRMLQEAMQQGNETGLPVVVALDDPGEKGLGFRHWAAAMIIGNEQPEWMRNLVAVVVRGGIWDTPEPRPYTFLEFIPGPRAELLRPEVEARFERCPNGHVHFDPLAVGDRRTCTFDLS